MLRWKKQQDEEELARLAEQRLLEMERATRQLEQRVKRLEAEGDTYRERRLRELRRGGVKC